MGSQLRLQCLINNFVKSYAGTSASPPAALPPGPSGGTAAEAAARLLSLTVKSVRQQAPAINAQDVVSRQLHARVVLKRRANGGKQVELAKVLESQASRLRKLDGALEDSINSSLLDAVDDARTAKRLVRMFDLPERVVQDWERRQSQRKKVDKAAKPATKSPSPGSWRSRKRKAISESPEGSAWRRPSSRFASEALGSSGRTAAAAAAEQSGDAAAGCSMQLAPRRLFEEAAPSGAAAAAGVGCSMDGLDLPPLIVGAAKPAALLWQPAPSADGALHRSKPRKTAASRPLLDAGSSPPPPWKTFLHSKAAHAQLPGAEMPAAAAAAATVEAAAAPAAEGSMSQHALGEASPPAADSSSSAHEAASSQEALGDLGAALLALGDAGVTGQCSSQQAAAPLHGLPSPVPQAGLIPSPLLQHSSYDLLSSSSSSSSLAGWEGDGPKQHVKRRSIYPLGWGARVVRPAVDIVAVSVGEQAMHMDRAALELHAERPRLSSAVHAAKGMGSLSLAQHEAAILQPIKVGFAVSVL